VRAGNQAARRSGLPVVDGEVIWDGPDGYYHHYPSMGQVRSWLAGAGFTIQEEAEGPWHEEGYACHHVLASVKASPLTVASDLGKRRSAQRSAQDG
jgi:hypothetical protein